MTAAFTVPDWPLHERVRALMTTRQGGVSVAPFSSQNLGVYVGDASAQANRTRLRTLAELPDDPIWLHQVHGTDCVAAETTPRESNADASWTGQAGVVLAALAADCLPVLFAARDGTCIAAAHAGWRGLAGGVLENTISAMPIDAEHLTAWLGPAIGPHAFEVGKEVRETFCDQCADDASAFVAGCQPDKWMADIFALARARLRRTGVTMLYGSDECTVSNPEVYFSHRRDKGNSGRMAAVIWLDAQGR